MSLINVLFTKHPRSDTPTNTVRRAFVLRAMALSCAPFVGMPRIVDATPASPPIDVLIEHKIIQYLDRLRREGRLSLDETTAWSVYDLTLERKLVAINENTAYQSASMIKPFIALAFFYMAEENEKLFKYNEKHASIMARMIKNSSNSATNYFINLLSGRSGKPREIEGILKKHAPDVFQDTTIVERIPRNGRTYQNKASAGDYSRFLHTLWHDRFPYSGELKKLMQLPNKDRIFSGAKRVAPQTKVYDKTGTTARLCGNMGILVAKGKNGGDFPYTLVGIIEKAKRTENYTQWAATRGDVIREVSNIVYSELKEVYDLV